MALMNTPVCDFGWTPPEFDLLDIDGTTKTLEDVRGTNGTLIMFICNHCPYVQVVIDRLVEDCRILQEKGIGCAAIMPNDTLNYPADSYANMKVFAEKHGFTFPYLLDETQQTAKAFGAICTPDLFGFNTNLALQYRGRVDSAGPDEAGPDTVRELRNAMLQVAGTGKGPDQQTPSMGCSIKWRDAA